MPSQNSGPAGPPAEAVRGRLQTLIVLDSMLSVPENKQKLREAFQRLFDESPATFFRTYVVPNLPKESQLNLSAGSPTTLTPDMIVQEMDRLTASAKPMANGKKLSPAFVNNIGRLNGRNPDGTPRVRKILTRDQVKLVEREIKSREAKQQLKVRPLTRSTNRERLR